MGISLMRFSKPEFVLHSIYNTNSVIMLFIVLIGITACTAHYPVNKPISSVKKLEDYSLGQKTDTTRSSELLLLLAFSGGGTRAAAFSYGVLETLADTNVLINGKLRCLIDEIDAISSVSGGSFTATYYGLFGERIFKDFETKFLKNDVQKEIEKRLLSPLSWPKLSSRYYNRSELSADYYDELLFEKKTFQDIIKSKGPLIAINATDMTLGSQFSFMRFQFAPICTDLLSFPLSRAVTASSAVPGVFSSIILKNYAGFCNFKMPEWATEALRKRRSTTRQYQLAKRLDAYLNVDTYPYIHLLDGGISDNLGIRFIIDNIKAEGNSWNELKKLDLENTSRLAIIVVDAKKKKDINFAKRDYSIPIIDTLSAASSIPLNQLNQYSYETMELLRDNIDKWRASMTAGRCREMKEKNDGIKDVSIEKPECAAHTYLIEVNFDAIEDDSERKHLESLPTSFHLEPEDVDRLREAAKKILTQSEEFQSLVEDLSKKP